MADLIFNHHADNIIGQATATAAGGTLNLLYPLEHLSTCNPALPCKFTTLQCRIVFDFGAPVHVPFPVLIHHNLNVAAKWQGNATNVWTAPTLSVAFPIGALDYDGYRANIHLDVRAATGYAAFRYWSFVVDTDNALPIVLGELWLGKTIRVITDDCLQGNVTRDDTRPGRSSFKTRGGVEWVHAAIGRQRAITAAEFITYTSDLVKLRAWNVASGGMNLPTILIPVTDDSTDAWLARFTADWKFINKQTGLQSVPGGWLELARGPALEPAYDDT